MSALITLGITALYALLFLAVVWVLAVIAITVKAATMPADLNDVDGDDEPGQVSR